MTQNKNSNELIKIMQNITPQIKYSPQELIYAIETALLETLWMELAYLEKIEFWFGMNNSYDEFFAPFNFNHCDDNIEKYFTEGQYHAWVDLELRIIFDEILSNIEDDYRYYEGHTEYAFSLEYGKQNNHLVLSKDYSEDEYLHRQIQIPGAWEQDYHGIDATVIPNKGKIISILKERGFTFGKLEYENKKNIIYALIETVKVPHEGPTGTNFEGISEHLLDLIKIHPETPEDLKALISLSIS